MSHAREQPAALGHGSAVQDPSAASPYRARPAAERASAVSVSGEPATAASSARDEDPWRGSGWLVLLLPLACCGGPLLIGALAAAGALGLGALGAGVAVVLATVVLVARRRSSRCCQPTFEETGSSLSPREGAR